MSNDVEFNTSDIYAILNNRLLERDYFKLSFEEKKIIVEEELKRYFIIKKIQAKYLLVSCPSFIGCESEGLANKTIEECFEELVNEFSIENRFQTFDQVIHFLLGLIIRLQSFSITWMGEIEEEYIDHPVIVLNSEGLVDKLITHREPNMVILFKYVWDFYKNKFQYKEYEERKKIKDFKMDLEKE